MSEHQILLLMSKHQFVLRVLFTLISPILCSVVFRIFIESICIESICIESICIEYRMPFSIIRAANNFNRKNTECFSYFRLYLNGKYEILLLLSFLQLLWMIWAWLQREVQWYLDCWPTGYQNMKYVIHHPAGTITSQLISGHKHVIHWFSRPYNRPTQKLDKNAHITSQYFAGYRSIFGRL